MDTEMMSLFELTTDELDTFASVFDWLAVKSG